MNTDLLKSNISVNQLLKIFPIFLGLIGFLLRQNPSLPDQPFSIQIEVGSALIFIFWLCSLLAWGKWLSARFGFFSTCDSLLFGTLIMMSWMVLTGHLGLIHYQYFALHFLFCALGYFFGLFVPNNITDRIQWKNGSFYFLVTVVILICPLLMASIIQGTTDPHMYHLLGPRHWANEGRVTFNFKSAFDYNCWLWEYLYLWPQILLGAPEGGGLLEAQIFSQWIHFTLGALGSIWVSAQIMRILGLNVFLAFLSGLLVFSSETLRHLSWLAKNDWGAILMTFGMLRFYFVGSWLWAGVFAGLAIGIKLNALFFIGIFLVLDFIFKKEKLSFKVYISLAIGVFFPLFFICTRNYLATQNPIFPYGISLFSSRWMTDSLKEYFYQIGSQIDLAPERVFFRLFPLMTDSHLFLIGLGMAIYLWLMRKKTNQNLIVLYFSALFGCFWYGFTFFPHGFFRWIGFPLVMLSVLTIGLLDALFVRNTSLKKGLIVLILALQLPASIEWTKFPKWMDFDARIAFRNPYIIAGGDSKAWLRLAEKDQKILTTGDHQLYSVADLDVTVLILDPILDTITRQANHNYLWVGDLKKQGYRLILDTVHFSQRFWTGFAVQVDDLASIHPEAYRYMGPNSAVIDINVLYDELNLSCSPQI